MTTFAAFFDANVFFGARLRSAILSLAQSGQFRARWSADVHREWMRAVVKKRPDLTLADLDATRRAMDSSVNDCLVTGYESLIATLTLPDKDDRHILAAAIVARASVIVTFNERDFPPEALQPYGIHTCHPDEFLLDVADIDLGGFAHWIKGDLAHYIDPRIEPDQYLDDLRRSGVPATADLLDKIRVLWA